MIQQICLQYRYSIKIVFGYLELRAVIIYSFFGQCSGSVTFRYRSGAPCFWLKDPDLAIFVIDLQGANKKLFFSTFSYLLLFEFTFTSFFKDKKSEEGTKQLKSRFFFQEPEPDPDPYLWISDPDLDPGGTRTYGSGSATLPLVLRIPSISCKLFRAVKVLYVLVFCTRFVIETSCWKTICIYGSGFFL